MLPPEFVLDVPADGHFESSVEAELFLPAERTGFIAVHGVTEIVAFAVGDVADESLRFAERRKQAIRHIDVIAQVFPGDVVGFARDTFVQYRVDAVDVIFDIEPVALLFAVAIERQRMIFERFGDEEGQQLFGVLVGTEGVAAACGDDVHAVGFKVGAHHQFATRFSSGIGIARRKWIVLDRFTNRNRAINFIGRDLQEAFDAVLAAFVEQNVDANRIGMQESVSVDDAAIHMAFGSEIDDGVNLVGLQGLTHDRAIRNVAAFETIVRLIADGREILHVSGIGQLVVDDDVVVGVALGHDADKRAADEARATGDENVFHDADLPFSAASGAAGTLAAGSITTAGAEAGTLASTFAVSGSVSTKRSIATATPSSSQVVVTKSAASLTFCAACPIATPTPANWIISTSFSASPIAMTFSGLIFMSFNNCLSATPFDVPGGKISTIQGTPACIVRPAPPICKFNCQRSAVIARGSPIAISLLSEVVLSRFCSGPTISTAISW